MATEKDTEQTPPAPISTGAGIAIAGIWLGASAITVTLILIAFVLGDQAATATKDVPLTLLLILAAPTLVAFSATRLVLNRD